MYFLLPVGAQIRLNEIILIFGPYLFLILGDLSLKMETVNSDTSSSSTECCEGDFSFGE